ncbi:MAG: undecaprenyl/decaprenyl-phosphate alpha-N-acetylglucosaminyl 1-phosphate transferase [Phycisphaerae bacterium]|nr:undecaprenyl/decaprenyl-phosphate alpha-N-acetylglucosaminyl 1-phosphate transferase [Phycisphaerae bacterium]
MRHLLTSQMTHVSLELCLGAACVSLAVTPVLIRLGNRMRIVDKPGVRKIHGVPVPRLGGLAVALAALTALGAVLVLNPAPACVLAGGPTRILALLGASLLVFGVGIVDDVRGVRASVKLALQLLAALVVCAAGVRLGCIRLGEDCHIELGWLSWPITLLWLVGVTNAMNLIDGLDGLAGGIGVIGSAVIAVLAFLFGQLLVAWVMLALLGSLTGFLVFNLAPARIFLGDAGTYFVGFLLAGGSILCTMGQGTFVGMALPALALGIPILDTLISMLRRTLDRRSVFAPDRGHIHHRLLDMGISPSRAVFILHGLTLVAVGLGLLMIGAGRAGGIAVFACILALLLLVFHEAGMVRLGEILAAFRRTLAIRSRARDERRDFEEAQLFFREANSFDDWWRAVCHAAERMKVIRIAADVQKRDGTWRRLSHITTARGVDHLETARLCLPAPDRRSGSLLHIEVDIRVDGSLESTGRRVAYLGRLLEEHGPANALPVKQGRQSSRSPSVSSPSPSPRGRDPYDAAIDEHETGLPGAVLE